MSFISKIQAASQEIKKFKDPQDPKIIYSVTGSIYGRGNYNIFIKDSLLGNAYGKNELEALKNYLSSRGGW